MVSGLGGDARSGVPGLNVGVVVGAHLVETLSILVDERSVLDGIGGSVLSLYSTRGY
jgi:hypothetical protein